MHAEPTMVSSSSFRKISLQVNQFSFLGFHDFGELSDFDLRLFLVAFKLRFHLQRLPLRIEKLVVSLTKYSLHLIQLMSHTLILVFKIGKFIHGLHQSVIVHGHYLRKCF